MTLRQRFSKDPLKVVRQLDAFPKVPEECRQSTRIGGTRKQTKYYLLSSFEYPSEIKFLRTNFNFILYFSFNYQSSLDYLSHFQRNYILHG